MKAITRLLCPVDLSEPSAQALRYAASLASMLSAELTVLHVRADGPRATEAKTAMDESLDAFVSGVVGPEATARLLERQGEPVSEILEAAAAGGSDVIVMGTHGRTGLQRILLGSVAERVIRRSATPVLTVPYARGREACSASDLHSVLCAVDLSEPLQGALDYAASIAAAAGARLLVVHVLEWLEETEPAPSTGAALPSSEDDALAGIDQLLTSEMRARCATEVVIGYGDAADEVLRIALERQAGLVVLGIRKRNAIDLAVFGSTAQRLVRDGSCAILTVRAGEVPETR